MRKGLCMLMTLMCLLVFSCSALAAGTTVTTFTPFADMDFAAQGYMDIVTAWEEETGNIVEDYSGLQDDLFLQQMTAMVSGGMKNWLGVKSRGRFLSVSTQPPAMHTLASCALKSSLLINCVGCVATTGKLNSSASFTLPETQASHSGRSGRRCSSK